MTGNNSHRGRHFLRYASISRFRWYRSASGRSFAWPWQRCCACWPFLQVVFSALCVTTCRMRGWRFTDSTNHDGQIVAFIQSEEER